MTTGKTIALTKWTFVGKVMSLLFNMLSRLVITFFPRSKHLLISWLQSPPAVILLSHKKKKKKRNNAIYSNMDGHRDYHTGEVSHKETNTRYPLYVGSKVWHKRTYLQNRYKHLALRLLRGRGGEGWVGSLELADGNDFFVNWINTKVLLWSSGNSIPYPVINHDGKG